MFFDDLEEGMQFETASRTLSKDEIVDFAQKWDNQSFHTDEDAATASPYGGLIASGFHTLLTAFALALESGIWTESSMGSPGMETVQWLKPVRPGDTLRVRFHVLNKRASSSRPDRGRVEMTYEIFNQNDEKVAAFRAMHILQRKQ